MTRNGNSCKLEWEFFSLIIEIKVMKQNPKPTVPFTTHVTLEMVSNVISL